MSTRDQLGRVDRLAVIDIVAGFGLINEEPLFQMEDNGMASAIGMRTLAIRSANVSPSTNSITMNVCPSCSSRPWSVAMFE